MRHHSGHPVTIKEQRHETRFQVPQRPPGHHIASQKKDLLEVGSMESHMLSYNQVIGHRGAIFHVPQGSTGASEVAEKPKGIARGAGLVAAQLRAIALQPELR